jgi:protein-S-isoprenylcysteine O-methyltransferase Ste14
MYVSGRVMLLGGPIALGSWWSTLIVAAILPALIWRLIDEERFLLGNLPVTPTIATGCVTGWCR